MEEKLVNFRFEIGMYEELKMLALKEHVTIKSLITRELVDYVKKHKDGNPQFKIDQFQDPNFMSCPAYWRNKTYWELYCSRHPEELLKLKNQLLIIESCILRYL